VLCFPVEEGKIGFWEEEERDEECSRDSPPVFVFWLHIYASFSYVVTMEKFV
jgi:hypothetical protein